MLGFRKMNNYDVIYINNDKLWQKPVITEQQIFSNIFKNQNVPYNYIAFPWAAYIDKLLDNKERMIEQLKNTINKDTNYFTVVQHVEFRNYINLFKELNIKYIFTPHKINSDVKLEKENNIFIIPISIFPVQICNYKHNGVKHKKYIASFIGQINDKDNLSNIREKMYTCFKDKKNCMVKINSQMYYQDIVHKNKNQNYHDMNYKKYLILSKFSLCPSGTGSNSIRLWESLHFGCIPVILSDTINLPNLPIDYSDCFIFWKECDIEKLYDYLLKFDDDTINKMSENCIRIYNEYFNKHNMHKCIVTYFDNTTTVTVDTTKITLHTPTTTNSTPTTINSTPTTTNSTSKTINSTSKSSNTLIKKNKTNFEYLNKEKIILIVQYYHVKGNDLNYNNSRQKEIDYCFQRNFDNEYIDEIHIFLEEDCNLSFINNKYNIHIKKNITGKRINFKDIFNYYNEHLENNICILINSDIYLDKSIEIVKNINFEIEKLFISLNRFENNNDNVPAFLNGKEINEADEKTCQDFLVPFQESIWSQDAWIWKYKINNISDKFNFNLGVVGCDNYITYLMNQNGYKILNCSKIISTNHYDRLSIVKNEFGISKGNISKKTENIRIGCIE